MKIKILLIFLITFISNNSFCQAKFENYSVSVYQGKLKKPNFKSNLKAKKFITRIKEACKNGINFAGHYTLVTIGCGTACQFTILVDRKNGYIYNGLVTELGSNFKKSSRLFIKNSETKKNEFKDCDYCKPSYFVWNKNRFEKFNSQNRNVL